MQVEAGSKYSLNILRIMYIITVNLKRSVNFTRVSKKLTTPLRLKFYKIKL